MADPAAFIASWFTPSSLFIFVNLVIGGTIAITSRFTSSSPSKNKIQPQLTRSPSLLQRLGSFNLAAFYKHQPTPAETHYAPPESECIQASSLLERVRSFGHSIYKDDQTESVQHENSSADPKERQLVRTPSLLEQVWSINLSRLYRSDSLHRDQEEEGNEKRSKAEMRKSASERAVSMMCESEEEDEETVERRRPATVSALCREDEEVDTKADDFINRFKKQRRLQRLDSLIRYNGKKDNVV